jgi:hypothetical protein
MEAETMTDEIETDDEPMLCENCNATLPDDHDADEYGDQCQPCYARTHFHCLDCESDYELDEQSPKNKALCVGCQETKDEEIAQERLDAAKESAQELLDAIIDSDDLDTILKAVASLKRLQPK